MTNDMHRRRVWVLAAVALGVGVAVARSLGYLSTQNQSPAPAATVDKLSIALPALPHAALIHIAAAQGYLAEEGLEPTITPVSHGKAAIDAMAAGALDMCPGVGIAPLFAAAERGLFPEKVVAVAANNFADPGHRGIGVIVAQEKRAA